MLRRRLHLTHVAGVLAAGMLAMAGTGCGSDDEKGSDAGGTEAKAAEKAFLTAMVPHHESALEMAEIAKEKGKDPFVLRLAEDIRSTQTAEIAEMNEIHTRRLGGTLKPDPSGHDGLGLTASEAGMTHSADTNAKLASARPFDRAFVDDMVPHHEGAIRMAKVVLRRTKDASVRKLAESILVAQRREIKEMNDFRTEQFGGPVPAGAGHGTKSGREESSGHEGH